jgi:TonB-dependent receptor
VTDTQGQFTISDVTAGNYTITVSYVGFSTLSKELHVNAGEVARVDAVLQVSSLSEEIIVRAERPRGEAQALNRELTADNIVQVLPAEVITSLPNTNVADALGRLPGVSLERDEGEGKYVQIRGTEPRLTNVTIDGVNVPSPEGRVRNVKLDVIPADLVEAVEINKTLSANQDGDAIGGSVNLVTRSASDQPFFSVRGMGGYTPIENGRWLDQFNAIYGRRFGRNNRLGVLFGGSYDYNSRGIDDIEPSPDTNDFGSAGKPNVLPVVTSNDIREYWYYRHRYGFTGALDYRLAPGSTLYVRGLFSDFRDYGEDWIYTPSAGNFITPDTTDNTGNMAFSDVFRRPRQQIFNVSAGGTHTLGATLLSYEFAVSRATQTGGFSSAAFDGLQDVPFRVDTTNPFEPQFRPLDGRNIFDPNTYTMSRMTLSVDDHTAQLNLQGSVALTRQYSVHSRYGAFEVGAKVRNAHKTQNLNQQVFSPTGDVTLTQFLTGYQNHDFYFGDYQTGPIASFDKMRAFLNANPSLFKLNSSASHQRSDPNNYDTTERVYAGYVMNTIELGRVRLQAGVRIEGTQSSFTGNHVTLDNAGHFLSTTPIKGDNTYTDVLPSVQARLNLGKNTFLRGAYGMGIARPNFGDLPPFILEQDNQKRISVGNPALKPTHADNVDLLFEHYFSKVGVIQVGGFYKHLTDPIYLVQTVVPSGTFAGFHQAQPVNGPKAHIAGFEMNWEQHFTFLPGALSGIGFAANYSYTSSEATVPGRSDRPSLLRTAPNNWNVNVTYDRRALSARLGVTHNDENIFSYNFHDNAPLGLKGPNGDVYLYAHTQVDAQASYRLPHTRGLYAILSLLNLNNEVFGFYQGSPIFPIQREFYNRTFIFGLRWTSAAEK